MLLANRRWAWHDGWGWGRDTSIEAYRASPNQWFLVRQQEQLGPYGDDLILRMLRLASCPCVDGCQLGPPGLGWRELGQARPGGPLHYWVATPESELPPSQSHYDASGLEPVGCCCSTFDSMPQLMNGEPLWSLFVKEEPALWGYLRQSWNAHPAGSLVLTQDPMEHGMCIVDWPIRP